MWATLTPTHSESPKRPCDFCKAHTDTVWLARTVYIPNIIYFPVKSTVYIPYIIYVPVKNTVYIPYIIYFPVKNTVYRPYIIYFPVKNTVYRPYIIYFPVKNTVYRPYVYGSGQACSYILQSNDVCTSKCTCTHARSQNK